MAIRRLRPPSKDNMPSPKTARALSAKTDDETLDALRIAVESLTSQGHSSEQLAQALHKMSLECSIASRSASGKSPIRTYMSRST